MKSILVPELHRIGVNCVLNGEVPDDFQETHFILALVSGFLVRLTPSAFEQNVERSPYP